MQRNLFPSDRMIVSLRRTFHTERREEGVHVDGEDDVPQPSVRDSREDVARVTPCKDLIQVWSFEGSLRDSDSLELLLFGDPF